MRCIARPRHGIGSIACFRSRSRHDNSCKSPPSHQQWGCGSFGTILRGCGGLRTGGPAKRAARPRRPAAARSTATAPVAQAARRAGWSQKGPEAASGASWPAKTKIDRGCDMENHERVKQRTGYDMKPSPACEKYFRHFLCPHGIFGVGNGRGKLDRIPRWWFGGLVCAGEDISKPAWRLLCLPNLGRRRRNVQKGRLERSQFRLAAAQGPRKFAEKIAPGKSACNGEEEEAG